MYFPGVRIYASLRTATVKPVTFGTLSVCQLLYFSVRLTYTEHNFVSFSAEIFVNANIYCRVCQRKNCEDRCGYAFL